MFLRFRNSDKSSINLIGKGMHIIPIFVSGPNKIIVRGKPGTMDDKSYQWFGATVHSSGENGAIVVSMNI